VTTDRAGRLRRREQARRSLMDAARALLDERLWSTVTVDDLTRRAGLSRTAFYQHFVDREELLITLLDELAVDVGHVADEWMLGDGTDPLTAHRHSLAALTELWVEHGRLLGAVADSASHDTQIAAAYTQVTDGIIAATAAAIERDVANGHATVEDPEPVAQALTWMTERYLLKSFGRPPLADPATVTRTLTTIWLRTLYGTDPGESGAATRARSATTRARGSARR